MSHEVHHLLATLDRLGHPRVLVLGDLILDRYTWGDAERVSQEAPVLVLRSDQHESRLGGASSVAHLLRGLQAQVSLVGVIGEDEGGREVRRLLTASGVKHEHVLSDPTRPTTVKQRFIGRAQNRHPHQILRVDSEVRSAIGPSLERDLVQRLVSVLSDHDVLLISDYDKGVCTPRVLQQVISAAKQLKIPVIVDPIRSSDYSRYRGCTTMTPNRLEAQLATGMPIKHLRDTNLIGRKLCKELDMKAAIVTLDRDGMAVVPRDGGGVVFPTRARNVYDITGAGDMVLAMIGLCIGAGTSLVDAVKLGNVAGGLEVERVGVVAITRDEMRADLLGTMKAGPGKVQSLEETVTAIGNQCNREQKVVFTNGCFDLLHVGHVTYLQEAASHGDVLVVGLNSDSSVRNLKGPSRPVITERERATMLAALACVDYVVLFDGETPLDLIRRLQPDVLVKGGNYEPDQIVGKEFVEAYGGKVCVTGMVDGISTTNLIRRLTQHEAVPGPHFNRVATGNSKTAEFEAR